MKPSAANWTRNGYRRMKRRKQRWIRQSDGTPFVCVHMYGRNGRKIHLNRKWRKVELLKLSDWRNTFKIKSTKLLTTIRSLWLPPMRRRKIAVNDRSTRAHTANGETNPDGRNRNRGDTIDSHDVRANAPKDTWELVLLLLQRQIEYVCGGMVSANERQAVASATHLIFHFDAKHFIAHIKSVFRSGARRSSSTPNRAKAVRECVQHAYHTNSLAFILCASFVTYMSFITLLLFGEWRNDRIKGRRRWWRRRRRRRWKH